MLSEIAIVTLTLSAAVSGPQDGAGEVQAPYAPNAPSAQFSGLDGPSGLLVYGGDPHCRAPAVRPARTEVRASGPTPRLPAISGQYQPVSYTHLTLPTILLV